MSNISDPDGEAEGDVHAVRRVRGNVVSPGVNGFIIPNYKQTWANIRKISDAPEAVKHLPFKSREYPAG